MPQNEHDGVFNLTPWNQIAWRAGAAARKRDRAHAEFCRLYWRSIFRVLIGRGFNRHDAEDITQDFLLTFLNSDALTRANPAKGRFRDFLVSALNHYLVNRHLRRKTLKRGGDITHVSLDDFAIAENETLFARARNYLADVQADREWATRLLDDVIDRLELDYARAGRGELFRALKSYLINDGDAPQSYWRLALRLRRSPAALRKNVERLRAQLREKLREELAKKFGEARVDEELENLRRILRSEPDSS